jgi:hypothetical protein
MDIVCFNFRLFLAELYNPILLEVVDKIYLKEREGWTRTNLAMPFLSSVGKNRFAKLYFLDS